ncbi:MAG: 23S rRNA (guanosine(2251)-2'-O)-methyltransferase RlmB [Clostridiales Family XIII bacterium]|jgi:23S rRNA (guanosine2251-2'-O)-methyltransferase|nr:23S rRNA (guanosine(2251)-2'-O)-methyltransferase RlmB [Clostridiales Family XIII bacterium]
MREIIYGKNSILSLLDEDKSRIKTILIAKNINKNFIKKIKNDSQNKKIPLEIISEKEINKKTKTIKNQGIMAYVESYNYASSDEILSIAEKSGREKKTVLFLDGITDPRNLGALIRSAVAFDILGIIIPNKNAAPVNMTVSKTAVGLENKIKIAKVKNLNKEIEKFKEKDFWFYGLDMTGKILSEIKFNGKIGLVIGSEGKGISKLTKVKMDFLIRIPMSEKVESLNASTAGGIAMFEILK